MKNKTAFTLIELLVVISIIALLLSILLPSLKMAKAKAMEIYSMSNIRALSVTWGMYANDNDMYIVSGMVSSSNTAYDKSPPGDRPGGIQSWDWVHPAISETNSAYDPGMTNLEREIAGIRQGALWPYTQNEKMYHSPGDRTWNKDKNSAFHPQKSPYRSYTITDAMGGFWKGSEWGYLKVSQIVNASGKMVFLEEEDNNGDNWGSWVMYDPLDMRWFDPVSAWYGKSSTLIGFSDGHTEKKSWSTETKNKVSEDPAGQLGDYTPVTDDGIADLRYMQKAYFHKY